MDKKYLVVRPKYGLCNQLLSISKGIIFGLISKRDVIFSGFQLDYRNDKNLSEFHDIIDIEYLQNEIDKLNLNLKIHSNLNIDCKKINTFTETNISYIKDFETILLNSANLDEEYLDIDNPISSNIPEKYKHIYKFININIKFVDKYITIANNIKQKLNLKNYTCIHLRLEDDAINFMYENNPKIDKESINTIYKKKYIDELNYIKDIKDHNIYICTSLIIDKNINNEFYLDIKEQYKLLDKNNLITVDKEIKYREIYGIIDYIIAKDSIYFIGADWSSFSIYIYDIHISNNKAAKFIDIYDTIKNII